MLGTDFWLASLSTTAFLRMLVSQRTCRMRFMSVHQSEGKVSQKSSCVGPKIPKSSQPSVPTASYSQGKKQIGEWGWCDSTCWG